MRFIYVAYSVDIQTCLLFLRHARKKGLRQGMSARMEIFHFFRLTLDQQHHVANSSSNSHPQYTQFAYNSHSGGIWTFRSSFLPAVINAEQAAWRTSEAH